VTGGPRKRSTTTFRNRSKLHDVPSKKFAQLTDSWHSFNAIAQLDESLVALQKELEEKMNGFDKTIEAVDSSIKNPYDTGVDRAMREGIETEGKSFPSASDRFTLHVARR